jgi:hypothetical protein
VQGLHKRDQGARASELLSFIHPYVQLFTLQLK